MVQMNWHRIQGNWKQVAGKAKEQWGKLTDDDLDVIAGHRDELGINVSYLRPGTQGKRLTRGVVAERITH
jgi:CsbD-like